MCFYNNDWYDYYASLQAEEEFDEDIEQMQNQEEDNQEYWLHDNDDDDWY